MRDVCQELRQVGRLILEMQNIRINLGRKHAFDDRLRDAVLRILFTAGSNLVVVPVQDIFGWKDRINTPAIVDDVNWRWRMPWPVEDLKTEPVPGERSAFLRELSRSSARDLR